MFKFLLLFVGLAVVADALLSGFTLMASFQANNILSQILVFSAGCIITGFVVFTKEILVSNSLMLKLVWLVSVIVDAYTTFVGVIFYMIMGEDLSNPIEFSAIQYDPSNWPKTIIVFSLTFIVTGASVSALYVLENSE